MLECLQCLSIRYCVILGAPNVAEVTVLWANTWVVQPIPVHKTALKTAALRMVGRRMSTTGHDLAVIQQTFGWLAAPLWLPVSIRTAYGNNYSAEVIVTDEAST